MAEISNYERRGDATFHTAIEAQWQQLRRQFELAEGFWVGFLFCPSPHTVSVLRHRTEQILKFRVQHLRKIQPNSPEELRAILPLLFEPASTQASCVWIDSIHVDSPLHLADGSGPWSLAWDHVLLRANEHRDALRRHLTGALIFSAPPEVKPHARDAAPDLWSIRSLVLDLAPIRNDPSRDVYRDTPGTRDTHANARGALSDASINVEFALAEIDRITRRSADNENHRAHGLARIHLRAIEGLLQQGRTHDAVDVAAKTLTLLRERRIGGRLLAEALVWSSEAARADDDVALSLEHLIEAVEIGRNLLSADDETPQALRDLSVSLNKVGDAHREAGELAAATSAHEESLGLCRRLLEAHGETPQALRDLSVSLDNVGDARLAAGELAAATSSYQESLGLRRRLLEAHGETPQALRDLSVSLDNVGDARLAAGESAAATSAYQESLGLRRRLLEAHGETPQALRDLSISLNNIGDARREGGELAAAATLYEEALTPLRAILNNYAQTPRRAFQDVMMTILGKLEDVAEARGDRAASAAYRRERKEIEGDPATV